MCTQMYEHALLRAVREASWRWLPHASVRARVPAGACLIMRAHAPQRRVEAASWCCHPLCTQTHMCMRTCAHACARTTKEGGGSVMVLPSAMRTVSFWSLNASRCLSLGTNKSRGVSSSAASARAPSTQPLALSMPTSSSLVCSARPRGPGASTACTQRAPMHTHSQPRVCVCVHVRAFARACIHCAYVLRTCARAARSTREAAGRTSATVSARAHLRMPKLPNAGLHKLACWLPLSTSSLDIPLLTSSLETVPLNPALELP